MLSVLYFIFRVRAFLLGAREVVAILASRRASDFFYAALFRAFFYTALFSRGRLCSFVWFFQVFVPPCTPSPLRAHLNGRHRSDLLAGERLTFLCCTFLLIWLVFQVFALFVLLLGVCFFIVGWGRCSPFGYFF